MALTAMPVLPPTSPSKPGRSGIITKTRKGFRSLKKKMEVAPIGIIGKIIFIKLYLWCFLAYNLLSLEITFFNLF